MLLEFSTKCCYGLSLKYPKEVKNDSPSLKTDYSCVYRTWKSVFNYSHNSDIRLRVFPYIYRVYKKSIKLDVLCVIMCDYFE